jgi:hypothetical protein
MKTIRQTATIRGATPHDIYCTEQLSCEVQLRRRA